MNAKCPCCKGTATVKRGFNYTKKRGKQQRMKCNNCGHTFIVDLGFWHMHNKEEIITMCVDMYLSNLSSRKMRNQLRRHFGIKVSHVTILDWVRKYVLKVQKFVQKIKPQLSGKMYADETEVDCENRKDIFWCCVDWDTRFINATLYSNKSQNLADATEFMKRIKATKKPYYIQTDALPFYPKAFKKVFYSRFLKDKVAHSVVNYSKTKKHNVRIETVFMKVKDRVNDFRGFKALWSAPILMAGIILQHNYIEKHSTTAKVPCELAGQSLNLGENRWLDLIRLSAIMQ
ncbi:MAG: IS6 family transposase [Candidatus Aenigmarchaeota archaeon]|nr:IS6 family transposase [Candidatus Aenigmarchaeota archaeon]